MNSKFSIWLLFFMTNVRNKFESQFIACLNHDLQEMEIWLYLARVSYWVKMLNKPQWMNYFCKGSTIVVIIFIAYKDCSIPMISFVSHCVCFISRQHDNFKRLKWLLIKYLCSRFYVAFFLFLIVYVSSSFIDWEMLIGLNIGFS